MVQYKVVTLDEVIQVVDASKPVMLDLETKGLYGNIELAQFMQEDWVQALIVDRPDAMKLRDFLDTRTFVAHNATYEISTIQRQTSGRWTPKNWHDTLLTSYLHFWSETSGHTLDACYSYALSYDPYESQGLAKKELQKQDWSVRPLSENSLLYAATDVFYMPKLYNETRDSLDSQAYKLLKMGTNICFDFQQNGMAVSEHEIEKMIVINELKLEVLDLPINPKSYKQIREYLDVEQSDNLFLMEKALEGMDKAYDVVEATRLRTEISWLTKTLKELVDGRYYGLFSFSTISGRGKSYDSNLQQIPRTIRGAFKTPEGRVLVISDYSQLELRLGCVTFQDRAMYKAFQEDVDLHQYTADIMNVGRREAKTCNFNLLYGGSAKMLRSIFIKERLLLDIAEVRKIKAAWHKTYPDITKAQKYIVSKWRQGQSVGKTRLGRQFKAKLFTDAINLPVQGGAADIAKLAMHYIRQEIDKHELDFSSVDAKQTNFIHDQFIYELDDSPEHYKALAKIMAKSMQKAWFTLIKGYKYEDLKMPVEVLVGRSWGNLDYGKETPVHTYDLVGDWFYKEIQ